MKLFFVKLKRNFIPLLFFAFMLCLIFFSKSNIVAVKNSLNIWINNVVPSLFPFFIATEERADYPYIAKEVCKEVQGKKYDLGIIICKTGYGMSIVANKFKGIRCANCYSEESARFAKLHNNINVLALGAEYLSTNDAICIIRMILATEFEGGRHLERLNMINEIEKENMK